LHEAKEDAFNQQEQMSEKWRPILGVRSSQLHTFPIPFVFEMFLVSSCQQVESILVSVVSMLSDPNSESPANIDASVRNITLSFRKPSHFANLLFCCFFFSHYFCIQVQWRNDFDGYKKRIRKLVRDSQEM
jgi:hypothetical protein